MGQIMQMPGVSLRSARRLERLCECASLVLWRISLAASFETQWLTRTHRSLRLQVGGKKRAFGTRRPRLGSQAGPFEDMQGGTAIVGPETSTFQSECSFGHT